MRKLLKSERTYAKNRPNIAIIDYEKPQITVVKQLLFSLCVIIFSYLISLIFYHSHIFSFTIASFAAAISFPLLRNKVIKQRRKNLRRQFLDMLQAMEVAMQAGENIQYALQSAQESLTLIYNADTDIIIEMQNILLWLKNNKPLKECLSDLARRSGLTEIAGFATVFEVIDGKSDKDMDIISETQKIILETLAVEMEIETLITEKKQEQLIMIILPIFIIAAMTYSDLMGPLYSTTIGRLITTFAILLFIISYIIARHITKIDV